MMAEPIERESQEASASEQDCFVDLSHDGCRQCQEPNLKTRHTCGKASKRQAEFDHAAREQAFWKDVEEHRMVYEEKKKQRREPSRTPEAEPEDPAEQSAEEFSAVAAACQAWVESAAAAGENAEPILPEGSTKDEPEVAKEREGEERGAERAAEEDEKVIDEAVIGDEAASRKSSRQKRSRTIDIGGFRVNIENLSDITQSEKEFFSETQAATEPVTEEAEDPMNPALDLLEFHVSLGVVPGGGRHPSKTESLAPSDRPSIMPLPGGKGAGHDAARTLTTLD